MEIDEIRVIVCEGKHLKGKKKDQCRASVIFGIGNDKFRTTIVDEPSGNVSWNEEQIFAVSHSHLVKGAPITSTTNLGTTPFTYKPLIFTVKDKDHVIGRVVQPLNKLTTTRKKYRSVITPADRPLNGAPIAQSEQQSAAVLIYECWITKYRALSPAPRASSAALQYAPKGAALRSLSLRSKDAKRHLPVHSDNNGPTGRGATSDNALSPPSNGLGSGENRKLKTNSLTRVLEHGGIDRSADDDLDQESKLHRRQFSSSSSASSTLPRRQTTGTALLTSVRSFFSGTNPSHRESEDSTSVLGASGGGGDEFNPFEPSPQNSITEKAENGHHIGEDVNRDKIGLSPVITGLSPMEGPVSGGTKITVRGQNLGLDAADIISVHVCGVDCTRSLKYYTPSKITICTVADCPPGQGEVLIVTSSAGPSRCLVRFKFYLPGHQNQCNVEDDCKDRGDLAGQNSQNAPPLNKTLDDKRFGSGYGYGGLYYLDLLKQRAGSLASKDISRLQNLNRILPETESGNMYQEMSHHDSMYGLSESTETGHNFSSDLSSYSGPPHLRRFKTSDLNSYENCSRDELLKDIYSLRRHVEDLTTENKLMRYYVDTLVLRVMEVCPEHLEKSHCSRTAN